MAWTASPPCCVPLLRSPLDEQQATELADLLKALANRHQLVASRDVITTEREWLGAQFDALGIAYAPSSVNYLLLDTGAVPAAEVKERLIKESILVRDCTSFGLPFSIRVAVRGHEENARLVEVLGRCMH